MAVIRNILFSILAVTFIAACAYRWDVESVRKLEVAGSPFDKAIKEEFTEFASLEATRGDWDETERYLIRARAAAEGVTGDPYYFLFRKIPFQVIEDVNVAHVRLLKALEDNARVKMPDVAAEAQMGYECWIEALEENLFIERMEACKNKFDLAMDIIEGKPRLTETGEPVFPEYMIESTVRPYYVVYFDFNKTDIKPIYNEVINQAGVAYQQLKPETVVVSGHADTVGSDKVNMIVSRNRANNVSKALNEVGVPKEKMDIRAFGKKQLAVQTPDNTREPRNRRVEIELTGIVVE